MVTSTVRVGFVGSAFTSSYSPSCGRRFKLLYVTRTFSGNKIPPVGMCKISTLKSWLRHSNIIFSKEHIVSSFSSRLHVLVQVTRLITMITELLLLRCLAHRCLELPVVRLDVDAWFHREGGPGQEEQLLLVGERRELGDVHPDGVDAEQGAGLT